MAYHLKQELKLSQRLLLTPQLQLSIKLLQTSRQELVEAIREEVSKNPVLEEILDADEGQMQTHEEAHSPQNSYEMDWQAYIESSEDHVGKRLDFSESDEDDSFEKAPDEAITLKQHLMLQLKHSSLNESGRKIGELIIDNIDEHGYLRVVERTGVEDDSYLDADLRELSRLLGVPMEEVATVLHVLQSFDPAGVAARTTKECLLLQARRLDLRDAVVEELVEKHLDKLAKRNYKAISKEMNITVERALEAAHTITESLNPVPGSGFGADAGGIITPDVFIQKIDDDYCVSLNEDGLPKLKISAYYKKMLSNGSNISIDTKGYIQERLRSAAWLIKSIHQRQRTLKRCVESIVKFQRDFLDNGLKFLKPLILKDVAVDIGMHESTISRVTVGKYAHTPRGLFELKYFFSTGGANNPDGCGITAQYIKERVKTLIQGEDARHPLSDHDIVEKLKGLGVVLARRTVAKYREELGILSSNSRRGRY